MKKNVLFFILFFILLLVSLSLKVMNTDIDKDSFLEENASLPIEGLLEHGFFKVEQYLLLNNEFMVTSLVKYKSCNQGSLYITPLFRNSEGVSVLKEKIVTEADNFYLIHKGQVYDSFPSLRFWTAMNIEKISNIFDNADFSLEAHYVLAVVERGSCNLKNTLNWQDI